VPRDNRHQTNLGRAIETRQKVSLTALSFSSRLHLAVDHSCVFVQTAAKEDLGLGLKAVWYGAEQFGNVVGLRNKKQRTEPQRQPTQVLDEVPLSAGLVNVSHRCCCRGVSCVPLPQQR